MASPASSSAVDPPNASAEEDQTTEDTTAPPIARSTRSSVERLPQLSVRAGPLDGAAWIPRLKQELQALIAYAQHNKAAAQDWFVVQPADDRGTRWTGKCWYVHDMHKYEFKMRFEVHRDASPPMRSSLAWRRP